MGDNDFHNAASKLLLARLGGEGSWRLGPAVESAAAPAQLTPVKTKGPPYYFRITRNTFSGIYRSNQLPKAGETILAQALQVEGGPFWIRADIPVTIPSIDDPLSGTIDMIACEVPTMKGGRRTRRRRPQKKHRKTRRA